MLFDEELERKILFGLTAIIIMVIIVFAVLVGIGSKKKYDYEHSQEYYDLLEQQENCDHEYIITSDGQGRSLRVYSKCRKCGKEFY